MGIAQSPASKDGALLILKRINSNQDLIFRVKTKKSLLEFYLEMRGKTAKIHSFYLLLDTVLVRSAPALVLCWFLE